MNASEIVFSSASSIVNALATGQLSLGQVTTALRRQIDTVNPQINAFDSISLSTDAHGARASALPLAGLPMTVKDQIQVAGQPCRFGLDRDNPQPCEHTATPIQRLIDAGANIVGKTHLPPYAMDFQTFNQRVGRTNNPWHSAYSAGGSSGGGAAAVAAGMSFLDIGADLAGSLRMPAACCGVLSFLPSEGAVPTDGMLQGTNRLEHFARMGPIARHVEDLILAWRIMSDTRDAPVCAPNTCRIAVWSSFSESLVDEPIAQAMRSAQAALNDAGIGVPSIADLGIDDDHARRCFGNIMGHETGRLMPFLGRWASLLLGQDAARRSPAFLSHVHHGQRLNGKRYQAALEERTQLQHAFDQQHTGADALLIPVMRVGCFKHLVPKHDRFGARDYTEAFDIGGATVNYFDAITWFTAPISLLGNPVVTLPIGLDESGLPIGAQLVGKRGQDSSLLALSSLVVKALPAFPFNHRLADSATAR